MADNTTKRELQVGDVKTVKPNTVPAGVACTYATSDPTIVSISTAGPAATCLITAVAVGVATITVTQPGAPPPVGTFTITVTVVPANTYNDYIANVSITP